MKTEALFEKIRQKADALKGEEQIKYLRGLRDGADLSMLIADDNGLKLAGKATFQSFLDYLDKAP